MVPQACTKISANHTPAITDPLKLSARPFNVVHLHQPCRPPLLSLQHQHLSARLASPAPPPSHDMDKYIDSRFERLEKALSSLIDSVAKYHPSVSQAEELKAADTELGKGLEQGLLCIARRRGPAC